MTSIQELVERSIYIAIMKKAVILGYSLDTTLPIYSFQNDPQQTQYNNDLKAITNDKGFAVEIFSVGNKPDLKRIPRIAIRGLRASMGEVGNDPQAGFYLKKEDGNYQKLIYGSNTSDFTFAVHLAYATAQQYRILAGILHDALGIRKFIPSYLNPDDLIFITQGSYYDIPDSIDDIEEVVYPYEVKDINMIEEVVDDNIAKITEIKVDIKDSQTLEQIDEINVP